MKKENCDCDVSMGSLDNAERATNDDGRKRIASLSINKEVFNNEAPLYNDPLKAAGYDGPRGAELGEEEKEKAAKNSII